MIELVLIILIVFSIVWFLVWFWFFRNSSVDVEKIYLTGVNAFDALDFKKAKDVLLKIPNLDSNPDAKYKLGLAHFELGEYDNAKNIFEQILKVSPKSYDVLSDLARTLQLQGKMDQALENYLKIIKDNSSDINSYLAVAEIYNKNGDYDKAIEILEKAKEIVPQNAEVLFNILKNQSEVLDLDNQDNYELIINNYKSLIGNPDLPKEFDISIAKVFAQGGNMDGALQHCKKAIDTDDSDIDAYRLLGLIQLIQNDVAGAKNSLTMALNLQPSNVETHNIFSYLLCRQDEECEREKCRKKYYKLIEKYIK